MATFLHRLSGHAPGIAPSVDAATVGGLGPADLQGAEGPQGEQGPAGEDARTLWVRVSSEGEIVSASTDAATVSEGTFEGSFTVSFDESLEGCIAQATITTDPPPTTVEYGSIVAITRTDNVGITSRDMEGERAARAFAVTVTC